MDQDQTIYSIDVGDIETVTEEIYERKPTKKEIEFVKEKIGDKIPWFDVIENILGDYKVDQRKRKER